MRGIFNNCGLKLLAGIVAAGISAYVYNEIDYPIPDTLYLPLQARNLNSSLTLTEPLPQIVTVRVRGPYRSIRRIKGTGLRATVDLGSFLEPGHGRVSVNLPEMGEVVPTSQDIDTIPVQVDLKQTATLPLTVNRTGQLSANLGIGHEGWSPREIVATGPRIVIDSIAQARIEPNLGRLSQELASLQDGVHLSLPVKLFDDEGVPILTGSIQIQPSEVDYNVKLIALGEVKVLKIVPDSVNEPPQDLLLTSLIPDPLFVPVPSSLVPDGIFAIRTKPIDLGDARTSFVVKADLIYPFVLPKESPLPRSCDVAVDLTSLEEEGPSAVRVAVRVAGADQRFEYVVSPPQLKVLSPELASLGGEEKSRLAGQVQAHLEVAGLQPGEHRIVPQVSLPSGLEQVRIIPNFLTLTIIERGD